ncbi:MAG: hypothetical protein OXE44_08320 [Nitrospinae bacterium]|nr:hypothetical protein [Nitrospinota bacterium]
MQVFVASNISDPALARIKLEQLDGRIDKIDERLRIVENKISKAMGWGTAMFLLLVVIQVVLKFANISISID